MVKSFEKLIIEGILEPGGMSDSEENVDDLDLNIKRIPCMDHKLSNNIKYGINNCDEVHDLVSHVVIISKK